MNVFFVLYWELGLGLGCLKAMGRKPPCFCFFLIIIIIIIIIIIFVHLFHKKTKTKKNTLDHGNVGSAPLNFWFWAPERRPSFRTRLPESRSRAAIEANMTETRQRIFERVDEEFAAELINDPTLYMKFTGDMRKAQGSVI